MARVEQHLWAGVGSEWRAALPGPVSLSVRIILIQQRWIDSSRVTQCQVSLGSSLRLLLVHYSRFVRKLKHWPALQRRKGLDYMCEPKNIYLWNTKSRKLLLKVLHSDCCTTCRVYQVVTLFFFKRAPSLLVLSSLILHINNFFFEILLKIHFYCCLTF